MLVSQRDSWFLYYFHNLCHPSPWQIFRLNGNANFSAVKHKLIFGCEEAENAHGKCFSTSHTCSLRDHISPELQNTEISISGKKTGDSVLRLRIYWCHKKHASLRPAKGYLLLFICLNFNIFLSIFIDTQPYTRDGNPTLPQALLIGIDDPANATSGTYKYKYFM